MTDQHLRIRLEPKRTAQLEALCGFVSDRRTQTFVAERCVFDFHMLTHGYMHKHYQSLRHNFQSIYKDAEDCSGSTASFAYSCA